MFLFATIVGKMDEIIKNKESVSVVTNMGKFNMPLEIFNAYSYHYRPTKDNFGYLFSHDLARAAIPESFEASSRKESILPVSWYETELDEKIRALVAERGINPRDYLDQYHQSNERTSELWGIVTPQILDTMARNSIFLHFSRYFDPIDRLTIIEHDVVGSSFPNFFGHPFMGGYSPDKQSQEDARKTRKEEVLDRKNECRLIGLIVYMNNENYQFGGDIWHYFRTGDWAKKLDQSLAEAYLGKIYDGLESGFSCSFGRNRLC